MERITKPSRPPERLQSANRFVIKRSELNTLKLFVEFYLPEHQHLLNKLRQGPYNVLPLHQICTRMFDGPFGSDRKVEMYKSSGVPFLRVKDVLPQGIAQDNLMYISVDKHVELARSRVVPGNVLMTIAGRVGTAAVFPEELGEGNITGHIVGFELPNGINPHYLALFLNSYLGEFQVKRWSHRTTRPELNLFEVGQIEIALPPRPIQDRIAQVMQDAYATRRAKLAEAERLTNSMDEWAFQLLGSSHQSEVFVRQFTVSGVHIQANRWDVSFHRPSNSGLSDNTKWQSLSSYASCSRDTQNLVSQKKKEYAYIAVQGMKNDPFSVLDNLAVLKGKDINGIVQSCAGKDVLLARLGPCIINKKSALVPDNIQQAYCSPEFLVITPHIDVDSRFLLWAIKGNFFVEQMLPKTTGATPSRVRLHGPDLLLLKVPKADTYQQKLIGKEFELRRDTARRLRAEAEAVVAEAKARVERMILGEEEGCDVKFCAPTTATE